MTRTIATTRETTSPPERESEPPCYDCSTRVTRVVGMLLEFQSGRMVAEVSGVRDGSDPECIHRMRVATRRMRAVLRTFRRPLGRGDALDAQVAELRWLGGELGRVRNEDVLLDWLIAYRELAHPREHPELDAFIKSRRSVRTEAHARLLRVLGSDRFGSMAADLERYWSSLLRRREETERLGEFAPGRLSRTWATVRAADEALKGSTSDIDLHALRLSSKRLRYSAEFFRPAYGTLLDQVIEFATGVQNTLGGANDAANFRTALLTAPQGPALRLATATCIGQKEIHLAQFYALWESAKAKPFRRRVARLGRDMERAS